MRARKQATKTRARKPVTKPITKGKFHPVIAPDAEYALFCEWKPGELPGDNTVRAWSVRPGAIVILGTPDMGVPYTLEYYLERETIKERQYVCMLCGYGNKPEFGMVIPAAEYRKAQQEHSPFDWFGIKMEKASTGRK